jgi:glyoxylase-like metal-dependent hydrolase (beta-lactamase superfamily II)
VFAVDFVTNDGVGYRDLPDYHFPEFFEALRRLQELPYDRIAFGHGAPGDRDTIERQIRYYDDLRAAVAQALERGLSEEEAVMEVRLPQYAEWRGYEEWFPLNVRAMCRWLRGEP